MRVVEAHRGHVLLAEDDEDYRRILTDWLSHSGFDVSAFGSGDDLQSAILRPGNPPFAVLTDLYMPGTSGFDLVADLRAHSLLDVIPVAVHSATAAEAFPDADVIGIPKPIELPELALILDCLCADAEKRVVARDRRLTIVRSRQLRRAR